MLFRKKIDQHCAYCAHAGRLDDEQMICSKKGIVPSASHCRRFRYDPLKRIPARPKAKTFQSFSDQDFSL